MRPLVILKHAMPVALSLWLIHVGAREFGVMNVAFVSVGLGTLWGVVLAAKIGMTFNEVYQAARFGMLLGFLGWAVCVAPVLSLLGYEHDTGPRKKRESCLAAIARAMRSASGTAPFDRLERSVEAAVRTLPDHPLDRPPVVAGLIGLLDDPVIRPQVVLAFGRYESQAATILPRLETFLRAEEPRLRAAAVVALAGMRPWTPTLRDRIFAMLPDKDPHVRDAAVTATTKIAMFLHDGDLEPLWRAAEASDPVTQAKVERLIGQLKHTIGPQAKGCLRPGIGDPAILLPLLQKLLTDATPDADQHGHGHEEQNPCVLPRQ